MESMGHRSSRLPNIAPIPVLFVPSASSRHARLSRFVHRIVLCVFVCSALFIIGAALATPPVQLPTPSLLLTDRNGKFLADLTVEGTDGDLGFWPLPNPPPRVATALIALEDRRFRFHFGVDPVAGCRAVWQNAHEGRRVSGASTLAMQLARLLRPGPRTYQRKAVEVVWACALTLRHGRTAVLANYLALAPYGNRVRGITFAARKYFDKPPADLSWAEIALLTALPQAPGRMNPYSTDGISRAKRRGRRLLNELARSGALAPDEANLALDQLDLLWPLPAPVRPPETLHAVLRLRRELQPNGPGTELIVPLTSGDSLSVRAALDLELQQIALQELERSLDGLREAGARQAAAIAVDRATNEVLVYIGSADYFDISAAGAINYAAESRSAGSSLKPFIYALALDRGIVTPGTVLEDLGRGTGGITNADDAFLGPLLPRIALATSRNVPAADLLARMGTTTGYGYLRDLGLHDGENTADYFGAGMAIGGLPVTLERLVQAYTMLARDGELASLSWFHGQPASEHGRLLSRETARLITLFLADPAARLPAFPRQGACEFLYPVAVKTGTSSRYRDAWTVAYSRDYIVGVWIGRADARPMRKLTGYNAAAPLVRRIMDRLDPSAPNRLTNMQFPPPPGYVPQRICAFSGGLAGPGCAHVMIEYFPPDQLPRPPCLAHSGASVVRPETEPEKAELGPAINLPAHFANWVAGERLQLQPPLASSNSPPARISLASPEPNIAILRDPDIPQELATLELRAIVDPPRSDIVFWIDGAPYRTASPPYSIRWPLQPGQHTIQAKHPASGAASSKIRISVL